MTNAVLSSSSHQTNSSLVQKQDTRQPTVQDLGSKLKAVESIVSPLWSLSNYVAVNPFFGLIDRKFLLARQEMRWVRDCELLPDSNYLLSRLHSGMVERIDLESALEQCREEYPELYVDLSVDEVLQCLEKHQASGCTERRFFTLSEIIDIRFQTAWSNHIVNDITRHCSAHFDEGQAVWSNPWKELPLYQAWRQASMLSPRMDFLGMRGFRSLVHQLPSTPTEAIGWLLGRLQVADGQQCNFLLSELFSVAGWASFVKHRVRDSEMSGMRDEDLIGLLAIRLAYDTALALAFEKDRHLDLSQLVADASAPNDAVHERLAPAKEVCARYAIQVATEVSHRRSLLQQLTAYRPSPQKEERKLSQMVFCIDVRSEPMRRHLEALSDSIETLGFAGFFGMAMEYIPLGESHGVAQCPVLLTPGFRVQEAVVDAGEVSNSKAIHERKVARLGRKIWKSFQTSAVSCFSYVESLGLLYFAKLFTDSYQWTRPVPAPDRDRRFGSGNVSLGPDLQGRNEHELSISKKVELAESMLTNLGLTKGFAKIVAICGHASDVANNPYKASLDCGACGGHSGEPNARVAASLLNDRQIRARLIVRGIEIPDDTWFVPAVHNTTSDEITFLDPDTLPIAHQTDFATLQSWTKKAGQLCRLERSQRHSSSDEKDVYRRCKDWSEVRPEWGLAGNAAFVIAPRSRTAGMNLSGRTFLHSYLQKSDPNLAILELIMTAPMIVTNWINMQYYASCVDPTSFGSGNKLIHNVVGQFGVLQGNGGDLMTGLPWQSIHDGTKYQHEPLRLLVVIESTREAIQKIINKHPLVSDLVSNGWITLVALENEACYRWTSKGTWLRERCDEVKSQHTCLN